MTLAVDIGTLTAKVATDDGVTTIPARAGGPRAAIRAALAAARPRSGFCLAVPETWLSGDLTGASRQEDARHQCEDVTGAGPVTWTGQLAAVAALTAKQRGRGPYLVCDVGGSGGRAGTCGVSDGNGGIGARHAADGDGGR